MKTLQDFKNDRNASPWIRTAAAMLYYCNRDDINRVESAKELEEFIGALQQRLEYRRENEARKMVSDIQRVEATR